MEFEVLRCGHCQFQTTRIDKLENHLKTKHSNVVDNENVATVEVETELISEIKQEVNVIESDHSNPAASADPARIDPVQNYGPSQPDPLSETEFLRDSAQNKSKGGCDTIDFNWIVESKVSNTCDICGYVGSNARSLGVHKYRLHGRRKSSADTNKKCQQAPCVGSSPDNLKPHHRPVGKIMGVDIIKLFFFVSDD
jgi:hypothetical protein